MAPQLSELAHSPGGSRSAHLALEGITLTATTSWSRVRPSHLHSRHALLPAVRPKPNPPARVPHTPPAHGPSQRIPSRLHPQPTASPLGTRPPAKLQPITPARPSPIPSHPQLQATRVTLTSPRSEREAALAERLAHNLASAAARSGGWQALRLLLMHGYPHSIPVGRVGTRV